VPYLGDIPVVGKLFRSKRQTAGSANEKVETLFFITVSLVDTVESVSGRKIKLKKAADQCAAKNLPLRPKKKLRRQMRMERQKLEDSASAGSVPEVKPAAAEAAANRQKKAPVQEQKQQAAA